MTQGLDSVFLTTDLPEYGLEQGSLGPVVLVYRDGKGRRGRIRDVGWGNGCQGAPQQGELAPEWRTSEGSHTAGGLPSIPSATQKP